MVRTAQPLGTLAVYLLEPRSEDGLATWNFFDAGLEGRRRFPGAPAAADRADLDHGGRAACRKPRARRGRSRSTRPVAAAAAAGPGGFAGAAAVARRRALARRPRRPAHEGRRRDRPLAAVHRRQGPGQGPGPAPLARPGTPPNPSPAETSFDMDPPGGASCSSTDRTSTTRRSTVPRRPSA